MSSRGVSTQAILDLLETGKPEEVCAAALLLGALKASPRRAIPALDRALEQVDSYLKPYLLDALARYDDPAALARLAPLLLRPGSLREQSGRILARATPSIAPLLRDLVPDADVTVRQAMMQILAQHGAPEDLVLMVELLHEAPFEAARSFFSAVRRQSPQWTRALRRDLVARLLVFLARIATSPYREGDVAAIKALGILGDARAIAPLLRIAEADESPIVLRRNAVEALASLEIPKPRRDRMSRILSPLLDHEDQRLAFATLRALRSIQSEVISVEHLLRSARSPHPDFAVSCIRGLVEVEDDRIPATLLEVAQDGDRPVREAACQALARRDDPLPPLIEATEDPRIPELRPQLLGAFAALPDRTLSAKRKREIRNALPSPGLPLDEAGPRLRTLCAFDPELPILLERKAATALRETDPRRAIDLLEPLVRHRLARPEGRYLLAIAHLAASPEDEAGEHLQRGLQLIGPLARLSDWKIGARFSREKRLPDAVLERLANKLGRKASAERALAELIRRKLS